MPYQPLEELLPKADESIYKLVILASQRALEIAEGMPTLVSNPTIDKPATLALDEIAAGKVEIEKNEKKKKKE